MARGFVERTRALGMDRYKGAVQPGVLSPSASDCARRLSQDEPHDKGDERRALNGVSVVAVKRAGRRGQPEHTARDDSPGPTCPAKRQQGGRREE